MTLHLPWPLANGEPSKANKMRSTHPNSILPYVLSYMRESEFMKKKTFSNFRFDQLWLFNFQFGCQPKSTNHIISASVHLVSNLKIDLEISQSREFIVKKTFLYFQCYTSRIHCDSSSPLKAKIRLVTPEKFSKHGFSFFHLILPFSFESWSRWHFGCLM